MHTWLKVIINKILRENIPNGYLNNLLNIDIYTYINTNPKLPSNELIKKIFSM